MLFSFPFILHPSAFILLTTPSLTVGLPPRRGGEALLENGGNREFVYL